MGSRHVLPATNNNARQYGHHRQHAGRERQEQTKPEKTGDQQPGVAAKQLGNQGIFPLRTRAGGWRYVTVEPWFGLTTTNAPVWIGAIYCTLESLVRLAAGPAPAMTRSVHAVTAEQASSSTCSPPQVCAHSRVPLASNLASNPSC